MSSTSFPLEIYLTIIGEVFNSQDSFRPISHQTDRARYQALRTQRLAWSRSLAGVCRAWVNPARTLFWEEVTLFSVPELVAFARAVDDDSAKPACIRRLYFRFPSARCYPAYPVGSPSISTTVVDEARRYFSLTLRRLPTHLNVLHIDCDWKLGHRALYDSLEDANRDPTWKIDVRALVIAWRPISYYDTFAYFTFARNIVHLELTITGHDDYDTFRLQSLQLQSIVLQMQFDHGSRRYMPNAAGVLKRALRVACTNLQSLTLNLLDHDEVGPVFYTEAAAEVLSLAGPSTSVLKLCAKPISNPNNIVTVLAAGNAFTLCPSLQHVQLDSCGVSPDVFQRLGCSALRQLEVIVTERLYPSSRDGVETMRDILASINLEELANLEELVVNFSDLDRDDTPYPSLISKLGPWAGTKQAWKSLEMACAARHIACTIHHPD